MSIEDKQLNELPAKSFDLEGNTGGVYFLFNNDELVYIGKGWNCLLRVAEHTRKDSNKVFNSWRYTEVIDSKKRGELERELIRKYKPIYNKNHNK